MYFSYATSPRQKMGILLLPCQKTLDSLVSEAFYSVRSNLPRQMNFPDLNLQQRRRRPDVQATQQ